ncbi:hypothetical protein YC2023_043127 [Brassica napus]
MLPVPSGGVVKLVGLGSTFGWIENWLVVRSERDLCVNRIVILDLGLEILGPKKSWASGTMLKNHAISTNSNPQHLYLHLLHDSRLKIRCSSAQRIKI